MDKQPGGITGRMLTGRAGFLHWKGAFWLCRNPGNSRGLKQQYVDETRGCTSDGGYSEDDPNFETCSEDLCNKVASCIVCDSTIPEHRDCLTNLDEYRQHCTLHGIFKENNCFRQESGENDFRLGCISEINVPSDCTGSDTETCKSCADEYCNHKEFPSCYACDACRTISQNNPVVDHCIEYYDKCYTVYERDSKTTKRGCMDDNPLEEIYETILTCTGVNCNGDEFPVHLQCHQCDDCDHSESITDYCRNILAEKCFTLPGVGGSVIRGCDTDGQFELCRMDPNCKICSGDNCNAPKTCYECDDCSTVDESTKKCSSSLGCYTLQQLDLDLQISRGCMEDESFKDCVDGINCRICSDNYCNVDQPRTEPLICSSCSGPDCVDYNPPKNCPNSIGRLIDYCVSYELVSVSLFKGCFSDGILEEFESDCYSNQPKFCKLCETDYCNTPALQCFHCSTTENGLGCLVSPESTAAKICNQGDVCVTLLDDEGHLHRGCSSEISCDGKLCESCSDEYNCNIAILPEARTYCYQCAGDESCLDTSQLETLPCKTHNDNDYCYTFVKDHSTIYRGCASDELSECHDNTFCVPCYTANGCNSQEPTVPNELSCVQCDGHSACRGLVSGTMCEKELLLGRSESCYTLKYIDLEIEKGCLSDLSVESSWYGDCLANNDKCFTCTNHDCNHGRSLCHKCNSKNDADCAQIVNSDHVTECEAECVSILNEDGYTVRDCIESIEGLTVSECDSLPYCSTCKTKECNSEIMHDNHLMCYQCMGDQEDCLKAEDWHKKACPQHQSNDACYTYFNSMNWVVRGCLSSKEDGPCVNECIPCDMHGCNKQDPLQFNTLTCISCKEDECDDLKLGSTCTEEILLGRQDYCYTYEDENTLQKGCLSDLKEINEIREACENNSAMCSICGHNNCNGDFHYCVTCDSSSYPACASSFQIVPSELTEDCAERKCVSFIDDYADTWKGCVSDLKSCDLEDSNCLECTGSMCNNVMFPDDRIMCHQCDNCNQLQSTQLPEACPKYKPDESCFTYKIDDMVFRGCSSLSNYDCDPSMDICLTCTESGCNNEPKQYDSTLFCIQCYGEDDCTQIKEPTPCAGSVDLGDTDQCFSLTINNKVLHKGCSRSVGNNCDLGTCEHCDCNGCNLMDEDLPFVNCFVCSGDGCGGQILKASMTCEDKVCMTYMSREGVVSRGCLKDFSELCSIYGNSHETCVGAECNGNLYPANRIKCHRCQDCAEKYPESEICPRYVEGDGCFTLSSSNGNDIARGCLSELSSSCTEPNCRPCYGNGCNNAIVEEPTPTTTITDSSTVDSSTVEPSTIDSSPVDSSTVDSSTVESSTIDSSTVESSTVESSTVDSSTVDSSTIDSSTVDSSTVDSSTVDSSTVDSSTIDSSTVDSSTVDSSTAKPSTVESSTVDSSTIDSSTVDSTSDTPSDGNYACIRCEESSANERCAWGYQQTMAQSCLSNDADCFTCAADGLIMRGCSTDEHFAKCSGSSIHRCSESGCNIESQKKQYCAVCSGSCQGFKVSFEIQECPGNIDYENRGCYVRKSESGVIIARGCVVSLPLATKEECRGTGDKCTICYEDGCNKGTHLGVFNGLIAAALILVILTKN
ncbi:uncharacterized protein LOC128740719 [Sabethes cyaneus]|uniref:uncharacterized protein LOC128740719 n=1 Tax=Sabethes cyaneus TaxID=53552 RepID=UPI00237E4D5E|nr:uncharacterized protein LOC128740719 [Sabethes cyaneus]